MNYSELRQIEEQSLKPLWVPEILRNLMRAIKPHPTKKKKEKRKLHIHNFWSFIDFIEWAAFVRCSFIQQIINEHLPSMYTILDLNF